jgi:FAD/FMN-containing dehydrogenase
VVDTRGLDRVLDYPARDMTITVQAGITLARLRDTLAAENQRLPVDVPHPDRHLGGAAANVSGPPFRLRRSAITSSACPLNDEGTRSRAAVASSRMSPATTSKLYIGSLGTLGVITQVTLKVKPRPEEQALVAFGCDDANLGDDVNASTAAPVPWPWTAQPRAAPGLPDAPWVVVVGFEDSVTPWTAVQRLIKELPPGTVSTSARAASSHCGHLVGTRPPRRVLTFRASVCRHVADCAARSRRCRRRWRSSARRMVWCSATHPGLTLDRRAMLNGVRTRSRQDRATSYCRVPPAWSASGLGHPTRRPRPDAGRQGRLDPRRLFNPGRFVDGI